MASLLILPVAAITLLVRHHRSKASKGPHNRTCKAPAPPPPYAAKVAETHEVSIALEEMIQHDGASSWPPAANHNHEEWPSALQPYKQLYLEMAPSLAVSQASLDSSANMVAIEAFRSWLRNIIRQRVDLDAVMNVLGAAENGDGSAMTRDVHNAFYACLSWCRHAYRYASLPLRSTFLNDS